MLFLSLLLAGHSPWLSRFLQLPQGISSIIFNCILNYFSYTHRKCEKKLIFAVERDHYRKPQLARMQRRTDGGVPSTKWCIYNAPPHLLRRSQCRRGGERIARGSEHWLWEFVLLYVTGKLQLFKFSIIWLPEQLLNNREWGSLTRYHHCTRATDMNNRENEWEFIFPRHEPPKYIHLCVCIHM